MLPVPGACPRGVLERREKVMSRAKKVVFVIVEGPTDEVAISSVLKGIFTLHEINFQEIRSDIK